MHRTIKSCIVLTLFCCFYAIPAWAEGDEIKVLATDIALKMQSAGKTTVAVVDFTDLRGEVRELGRFIAEELSGELTNAGGVEVVDRNHLKKILREQQFSTSGLADPATIQKLGRLTGARAIVTGTFTPLDNTIRVSCKVISSETGRVITAGKVDMAKTDAIEDLLAGWVDSSSNTSSDKKWRGLLDTDSPDIDVSINIGTSGKRKKAVPDEEKTTTSTKPDPPPAPRPVITNIEQIKEMYNFIIAFKGCSMSAGDTTIICFFDVTNNGKKRSYDMIYGSGSNMIDNFGNEYGGDSRDYLTIDSANMKTASVKFKNVNPKVSSIKKMVTRHRIQDAGSFDWEMNNLPIK